jgi:hypothetical protein
MGGAYSTLWDRRGIYKILMGNLKGRDHVEGSGVDGRVILRWIFRKWDVGAWN